MSQIHRSQRNIALVQREIERWRPPLAGWAVLPPYRMGDQAILYIPETGCGYTDVRLTTANTLSGIVLDEQGRPAPKIPVHLRPGARESEDDIDQYALRTITDGNGQFSISGLPDAAVYLSAGSDYPDTDMPYRRVYYPIGHSVERATAFHLKPGEYRQRIVLCLEVPLIKATARVRVLSRRGEPAVDARVNAFNGNGVIDESANTDTHGVAEVPCLRGLKYEMEAQAVWRLPVRSGVLKSPRKRFTCGNSGAMFELILDHSVPY